MIEYCWEPNFEVSNRIFETGRGTYMLQRHAGGAAVSSEFTNDELAELYVQATTDEHGGPVRAELVLRCDSLNDCRTVERNCKGGYTIRKDSLSENNQFTMEYSKMSDFDIAEMHRMLSFDPAVQKDSHLYMGYDSDGQPEMYEFGEVTPDELFGADD